VRVRQRDRTLIDVPADEHWKLVGENESLKKAMLALVNIYVANKGAASQFVACVTPNGNMREWDHAMRVLGLKLDPNRRMPRS